MTAAAAMAEEFIRSAGQPVPGDPAGGIALSRLAETANRQDNFAGQLKTWVTICISLSICGMVLLAAMNRRASGSGDQEPPPENEAPLILDVTELFPIPKAKSKGKAKAKPKSRPESSSRVGYLIEEEHTPGAASSSTTGPSPSASSSSATIGYGRGGISSLTPGQAASARGRKIMQIVIKPEAADAATQTSQADIDDPHSTVEDPPGPYEQPGFKEKSRSQKKKKGLIGTAYSNDDCRCENCAPPGEGVLGPEGVTPQVALDLGQAEPEEGSAAEESDDPLGWEPVGEVITTTTIVGRASSSSGGSDDEVPECERCENDGCPNRVGDWSYPECVSCWYEHE